MVQTPGRGFCVCSDPDLPEWPCAELREERERWQWALIWGSEAGARMRAERMRNGERRMTEKRFHEQMEAMRRELYCVP